MGLHLYRAGLRIDPEFDLIPPHLPNIQGFGLTEKLKGDEKIIATRLPHFVDVLVSDMYDGNGNLHPGILRTTFRDPGHLKLHRALPQLDSHLRHHHQLRL